MRPRPLILAFAPLIAGAAVSQHTSRRGLELLLGLIVATAIFPAALKFSHSCYPIRSVRKDM